MATRPNPSGASSFAWPIASETWRWWSACVGQLYRKLGYDAAADFAPIGLIGSTPNALAVHPSVAAATIAEFIALAKSRPGKLNYASAGLARALALPDTHKRLAEQSVRPNPLTPVKYAAFIRSERAKWAKVVKDVGIPQK